MKFKIPRKALLEATMITQGVVSSKNTLPILSNLLIETQKGKLILTATDLDTAVICAIQANTTQEGATTVPAKRLADIIKELPEGDVTVSAKKNNTITIDCRNTHFKVNTIPREEFPKIPDYKSHEPLRLEQQELKEMLNKTSFAISRDETRYVLNGILFNIKPRVLTLIATDGRRLALTQKAVNTTMKQEKKIIVPAKAVNELCKVLTDGETTIYLGKKQAAFNLGRVVIITRLIEGEFPRYEQVIPLEQPDKVYVDREALLAAARRANLLTSQHSQAIKLDIFKNRLVVSKNTPEIGETREELPIEYKGDNLTIGFNATYLIDVLKNIDVEKVGLELTAPDKPGAIRVKDDFIYVVLPMQIG